MKKHKKINLSNAVRTSAKKQLSETNQVWNRYIRLPQGMEQFRVKTTPDNKKTIFRILPYVVQDARNNPDVGEGTEAYYKRRFHIHRDVGPQKLSVICPLHTFGTECPICNEVSRMRRAEDEYTPEEIKAMSAREYAAYFIREKGSDVTKLLVMSTFLFDEKLVSELDDDDNGEEVASFANLEGGKYLIVRWEEKSFQKATFHSAESIKFKDAPDLEESVIEGLDLDSLLIETSVEDLEAMLEGTSPKGKKASDDDEDEDEKPKKKYKKASDDDDDEDDTPKKKSKKSSDDDDEDDGSSGSGDDDDDDDLPKKSKKSSDDDDDDDEDEKPAKKSKKSSDDDDDDDGSSAGSDDDDEDEKPKKKSKKSSDDDDDDDDNSGGSSDDDDEDETPKKKSKKSSDDDDDDDDTRDEGKAGDDDDDEDETPKKKSKKSSDDDDDDDEDEKPKAKSKKRK